MSITSSVSIGCFEDITGHLGVNRPSLPLGEFIELLRKDNDSLNPKYEVFRNRQFLDEPEDDVRTRFLIQHAGHHKYVVLREKETGYLIFCFVLNHRDTAFDMLAVYAGHVFARDQYRAVNGFGQLDQVIATIMTSDAAKKQFDWIGYGNFWLDEYRDQDRLCLEYKYPVLYTENKAYWHESLSELVRENLADQFGVYVAMDFTLKRQSPPSRVFEKGHQ